MFEGDSIDGHTGADYGPELLQDTDPLPLLAQGVEYRVREFYDPETNEVTFPGHDPLALDEVLTYSAAAKILGTSNGIVTLSNTKKARNPLITDLPDKPGLTVSDTLVLYLGLWGSQLSLPLRRVADSFSVDQKFIFDLRKEGYFKEDGCRFNTTVRRRFRQAYDFAMGTIHAGETLLDGYEPPLNVYIPNEVTFDGMPFREVYEKHRDFVYALLLRMTSSENKADDLTQETFVKVLRYADGYQDGTNLIGWIRRITHTTMLHDLKHEKKVRRFNPWLGEGGTPDEALDVTISDFSRAGDPEKLNGDYTGQMRVDQLVSLLPDPFSTLFEDFYFDDLTYEEAASKHGVPRGTVLSRAYRARYKLMEALADGVGLSVDELKEMNPRKRMALFADGSVLERIITKKKK